MPLRPSKRVRLVASYSEEQVAGLHDIDLLSLLALRRLPREGDG